MKIKHYSLKYIICILIGLIAVSIFPMCGFAANDKDIDEYKDDIETYVENICSQLSSYSGDQLLEVEAYYEQLLEQTPDDEDAAMFLELTKEWIEVSSEIGDVIGYGDFKIEKAGKSYNAIIEIDGTKRDAHLTAVYAKYDLVNPTAINAELEYTFGEKMSTAGINVVIGIATVFIILIIISLVIYAFRLIPALQAKFAEKKEMVAQADEKVTLLSSNQDIRTQDDDDEEVVAAIIAAIVAYTGQSADDFVVKKIRRRR